MHLEKCLGVSGMTDVFVNVRDECVAHDCRVRESVIYSAGCVTHDCPVRVGGARHARDVSREPG